MSTKKPSSQNDKKLPEEFAIFSQSDRALHHAYVISGERGLIVPNLQIALKERGPAEELVFTYETFQKEDALALRERAVLRAHVGMPRYFIIFADAWTREAQNSLLKMLEEPTAGTHFFLVVSNEHVLIPTIRSRVHNVHVGGDDARDALPLDEAKDFLAANRGERLQQIAKFLKKFDESETSGPKRRAATDFLSALEVLVREQGIQKNQESLTVILEAKSLLTNQGSLVKMILENVALFV
jgi:DNA polymerase III delta prime subunit